MPTNTKDNPATRHNTRKRNGSVSIPEEFQDIKNAHDGRKFLEKHMLLCPPGEPATNAAISYCLHQISGMAGVPKQTVNAIRATAFLLEEMEEMAINETVRSALDSQLTEFTMDMKLLVEDVNNKIGDHLKATLDKIEKATSKIITSAPTAVSHGPGTVGQSATTTTTYASALIRPPPNVDPRLVAREGIKARQFLLTGIKESRLGQHDTQELKAELNKAARESGLTGGKIRSALKQTGGNILIEVDSDAPAVWFANKVNRAEFCSNIGDEVTFKPRTYNVLAFNAPLNLITTDRGHLEEVNEANGLEELTITAMRWAKPLDRREVHQRSAHLILSFTNPEAANRAISSGIIICNKRCHAERIKKGPLRCLKCQGWNHMAKDCPEMFNTCGNCAERHRTSDCEKPVKLRCMSCKSEDHASWSRECPTFLRKTGDYNERNPDNLFPFFPTSDAWTWPSNDTNSKQRQSKTSAQKKPSTGESHQGNKGKEPSRTADTYIPGYSGGWSEALEAELDNMGDDGWGEVVPFNSAEGPSRRPPQRSTSVRFTNNSQRAGPSNANLYSGPSHNPSHNSNDEPPAGATNA